MKPSSSSNWITKADLCNWDDHTLWHKNREQKAEAAQLAKEKALLQDIIESLQHTFELVEKLQREITREKRF